MSYRKRLLYLAFWYPPARASGVYRALATSRAFADAGWDVVVLTTSERFLEEEVGSVDPTLLSQIPPDVSVIRIPFTFRHQLPPDPREIGWLHATYPYLWAALRRRFGSLRNRSVRFRAGSGGDMPLDDRYERWVQPAVEAGLRAAEGGVDHVLATGNPYSAFEAARQIAQGTATPFSIDYRDPWTIDVFSGKRSDLSVGTLELEKSIVQEAAACFHVNQALADAHAEIYSFARDRQHVVPNGFDNSSVEVDFRAYQRGPLRFGILGTANENWPLAALFEGWARARHQLPLSSEFVLAGHLGYFARSDAALRAQLPDDTSGFRHIGPVPKQDISGFYSDLDVVVVPAADGKFVTSGKVFEAAALGIPVVCVQAAGGGARAVLDDHPFAFGAEPTPDGVAEALLLAGERAMALERYEFEGARELARRFERQRPLERLVAVVEGL